LFLPLLAGIALASWLLAAILAGSRVDFDSLALGKSTISIFDEIDGDPITCRTLVDSAACVRGWERRGRKPAALWFGNSQVHGINQYTPGQKTAATHLQRELAERNRDLLAICPASGNFQEFLVLFEALRAQVSVDTVILAATFDDTTDSNLRPGIIEAMDDPAVVSRLAQDEAGREIVAKYHASARNDLSGLDDTVQQHTEKALDAWLSEHFETWRERPRARGNIFRYLYTTRNRLLGINSQSKRPLIENRYELNLAAFESIVTRAKAADMAVVVYVVPIRQDYEGPYVTSDYERFKRDVEAVAARHGAPFANLETLVPDEYWGRFAPTFEAGIAPEIDFMHFQAKAHVFLASAVGDLVLGPDRAAR
jgi:hypothetical protein